MIPGWNWYRVSGADPRAVALYSRHYSATKNGKGPQDWLRSGIMGSGEGFTLLTQQGDALFGWRHDLVPRLDKETGVNCTVFRNEGPLLSSDLIREADDLADAHWEGLRHFTYVDGTMVNSGLPGACFLAAGWRYVREHGHRKRSQRGLLILERLPS